MVVRFTAAALMLLVSSPVVRAQATDAYVGASGALTIQRADTTEGSGPSIPKPGISGQALGMVGELGVFIGGSLTLGGEVSFPARFESIQETRYFSNFRDENRHRDLILSALVGVHLPAAGGIRLALVAGPSLVREDTQRRRADQIEPGSVYTGHYGPFQANFPFAEWRLGVTTGVDVEIRASRRVSVVPSLRVHVVRRSGDDFDNVLLQMSSVGFRPAVGVRAVF